MTAIIAAACTFPSGPTLPLADVAHRLQFSLIRKHPLHSDQCGAPIRSCYFPDIASAPPIERFQRLIQQVLLELMARMPELKHTPPAGVTLLLPPLDRPGITSSLKAAAKEAVVSSTSWSSTLVNVQHGGQASAVTMIQMLNNRPTSEDTLRVLIAVDSWLLASSLKWLDDEQLLHGAHRNFQGNKRINPYGRVPSEGAAALVLSSSPTKNTPSWCHIRGTGMGIENVLYSDKGVCLGKGLSYAALQALDTAKLFQPSHIVSDINGEPYRADELGFTLSALGSYFGNELVCETPVLASGDLGCASLVTHIALTAWHMHSSFLGDTLLLSSSDDGLRGAIAMSKNQGSLKC